MGATLVKAAPGFHSRPSAVRGFPSTGNPGGLIPAGDQPA